MSPIDERLERLAQRPPTRSAGDVWAAAQADAAHRASAARRRLTGVLVAACLVVVAGGVWLAQRPDPTVDPPPITPVEEDESPPTSEPSTAPTSEPSDEPTGVPPGVGTGVVLRVSATAFDDGTITYDDLVRTTFATDEVGAPRVRAALEASADGAPPTVLSPDAVPDVSVDGGTLVLDWSSEDAASELGIWSTSSGSQSLWPIIGMGFANTDVETMEHRIDGSCEAFGERMQVGGCWQVTRSEWDTYVAGADTEDRIPGPG